MSLWKPGHAKHLSGLGIEPMKEDKNNSRLIN